MATNKLLTKLLHMKGFRAKTFFFSAGNILNIIVRHWKNGRRCPKCGRIGKVVYVKKKT